VQYLILLVLVAAAFVVKNSFEFREVLLEQCFVGLVAHLVGLELVGVLGVDGAGVVDQGYFVHVLDCVRDPELLVQNVVLQQSFGLEHVGFLLQDEGVEVVLHLGLLVLAALRLQELAHAGRGEQPEGDDNFEQVDRDALEVARIVHQPLVLVADQTVLAVGHFHMHVDYVRVEVRKQG